MRRRGLTFVELLASLSVVAVLSAVVTPSLRPATDTLRQFSAGQSLHQLGLALQAYTNDNDDIYPLGMYQTADGGVQTWFGYQNAAGVIDVSRGSISPYLGTPRPKDPAADYKDYFGDHSGYGYNYETLGSDFSQTKDFSGFPNCANAATTWQIVHPGHTLAFATSVFLKAPWLPGGDNKDYDFGFVSPPREWNGNPNVDFRHMGYRTIDEKQETVTYTGNALALFADGSLQTLKQPEVRDTMFERDTAESLDGSTSY